MEVGFCGLRGGLLGWGGTKRPPIRSPSLMALARRCSKSITISMAPPSSHLLYDRGAHSSPASRPSDPRRRVNIIDSPRSSADPARSIAGSRLRWDTALIGCASLLQHEAPWLVDFCASAPSRPDYLGPL